MSEYIYATDEHEGHWLTGEEIVRCRDCDYRRKSWNGKRPAFVPDGFFCAYWGGRELWMPDGFCACAKKKEAHCEAGPVYVPLSDEEKEILGDMPALRKLFENMGARFE